MIRKQYEEYFCWVVRDQGDFRKGPWVGKISMYAVVLLFRRFESFARLTYVWVLTCSKRDLSVKLTSRGVQWGLYKHFFTHFRGFSSTDVVIFLKIFTLKR